MSEAGTRAVDLDSVLAGARDLVPRLRERRLETADLRRLPDQTVLDLHEIGAYRLSTPAENHGFDLGPAAIMEVCRELARGCGSTAWCGGNWAIHGLLLSMFPVEAQREVFLEEEPFPLITTGFSPLRAKTEPTEGGAVVTGQWDFASGIDHADWVVVMAIGEQGPLAHLVPAGELEIVDTWHTAGLRGSGSKDVAGEEIFVPGHRLLSMAGPSEGQSLGREIFDSPWFRLPLASFFSCGIIGTLLGVAHGAIEVFVERTQEKIGGLSGTRVGTRADVHVRIGEAMSHIASADAVARSLYADMERSADEGFEMADRIRWRLEAALVGQQALAAINVLFDVGGAHVLWLDDQLNEFQRDATAASHHHSMAWSSICAGYGRMTLGFDHELAMV